MKDHVAEPTAAAPSPDSEELFESAAADFTRRIRAGERPTIEEYATRHPQIAELIRELLPTIAAVEQAKTVSNSGTGNRGRAHISKAPERLGDFRIVREIGSGGMGIVYEAVQESLGRNVAVKVLPSQMLADERRIRRFEQEARLAAQLHHTNIVPVFGVGCDDGLHYYVMQLIDGEGLDQALPKQAGGAFAPHTVAAIGRDAGRALQCAHEQGTQHRDVKPANILLDRTGHVWITDFGLAQALEAEGATTQAHVAGTLRYMPPERFHGISDARGDVYSLGVTLFELACGRTPFRGTSSVELMQQITTSSLPPLRTLDRNVPRDLETIVAKATAREPHNRYATAKELADDLSRFLDGVPIRARRISAVERTWRWCRRNRLTAAALLLAVVSLTSLTIVSAIGYWQAARMNAQLAAAFDGERTARAAAEATSATALQALDRVFERFAPSRSLGASVAGVDSTGDEDVATPTIPTVSPQIAAALEDLLPYYAKLAGERGQDPLVRRQTALAMHRVGLIHARLGRLPDAVQVWRQADGVVLELAAATSKTSVEARDLTLLSAELAADLGDAERMQDRRDEARTNYQQAIERIELIPPSERNFEVQRELARAHLALGSREGRGPPPPEGPPRPEGPPPPAGPPPPPPFGPPGHFGGGPPPHPGPPPGPGPLGQGPPHHGPPGHPGPPGMRPGPHDRPPPPHDEAPDRREHLDAAYALLTKLTDERPQDAETRLLLARCHRQRAKEGPPGRREWDSVDFKQATTLLRGLRDEFPDVPDFSAELCDTLVDFHVQELMPADWDSAGKQLREALAISEELVREHPQTTGYAISNLHIYNRLSAIERTRGNRPEEERALRQALTVQKRIAAQFPDIFVHVAWQVRMTKSLARLLGGDGRPKDAIVELREADAALEPFVSATPPLQPAVDARRDLRHILAELEAGAPPAPKNDRPQ